MLKFNKTELLDKIKDFISTLKEETPAKIEDQETKFEQETLENGTVIEYAALEEGEAIFIYMEDGNIPLPNGEYLIKTKLVIVEDGVITNVTEAEVVPEVEVEVKAEVKAETEIKVEASKEPDKPKEEASKEEIEEKPITFSVEDFDKKVEDNKKVIEDEYNLKLEKIKEGLDKLTLEVKESVIVQAPIEGKSKSKPLSTKEIMIDLINNKVKL